MAVTEIVRFCAMEKLGDEYERRLQSAVDLVAESPGCLKITILRQIENSLIFVCVIDWESIDHHFAWWKTERLARFQALMSPIDGAPAEFAHYLSLRMFDVDPSAWEVT